MTLNSVHFSVLAIVFGLAGCFRIEGIPVDPVPDEHDAGDVDAHVGPTEAGVPPREPFVVGSDIRDFTTDAARLYWVEHGTRDGLGNFQYDGKLLARSLDGGPVETLATGLAGPNYVRVTSTHAYMCLDTVPQPGGTTAWTWVRVPLAGGAITTLHVGRCAEAFVAVGDRALWAAGATIFAMASADLDAEAFLMLAAANWVLEMRVAGSDLYFSDQAGIERVPVMGGVPVLVVSGYTTNFDVYQGQLITLERAANGVYLTRADPGSIRERFGYLALNPHADVTGFGIAGETLVLTDIGDHDAQTVEAVRFGLAAPSEPTPVVSWTVPVGDGLVTPRVGVVHTKGFLFRPSATRIDMQAW